jgi:hypothetical protein
MRAFTSFDIYPLGVMQILLICVLSKLILMGGDGCGSVIRQVFSLKFSRVVVIMSVIYKTL